MQALLGTQRRMASLDANKSARYQFQKSTQLKLRIKAKV